MKLMRIAALCGGYRVAVNQAQPVAGDADDGYRDAAGRLRVAHSRLLWL